jgi:hypothetical protein
MPKLQRDEPLPNEFQGTWTEAESPASLLLVEGGEITCFGRQVAYDKKVVEEIDGAITVNLTIDDPDQQDSFDRANITGLALTPDGQLHVWNVKFGAVFVRAYS